MSLAERGLGEMFLGQGEEGRGVWIGRGSYFTLDDAPDGVRWRTKGYGREPFEKLIRSSGGEAGLHDGRAHLWSDPPNDVGCGEIREPIVLGP